RSEGAGNATNRNTRGLTRSVSALMVPPLPAASRPSKTMMARSPLCFTHAWSLHNSSWSLRNSFMYFFPFIFFGPSDSEFLLIGFLCRVSMLRIGGNLLPPSLFPAAAQCAEKLHDAQNLIELGRGRGQLGVQQLLLVVEHFEIGRDSAD